MSNRYRVSLNSNQMDEVDASVILRDIKYPKPEIELTVDTIGQRHGGVISHKRRAKASVQVEFLINKYGTDDRNDVLQDVIKWAKAGGALRCNDRENVALRHVVVETYPSLSAKDWTEDLSIVFTDYTYPFWEADTETTLTLTAGTDQSGSITLQGNADETYLNAAIMAAAAVTWVKVITPLSTIHVTGLSMASTDVLTIEHDDRMNLRIRVGNTSVLAKRTAASDDDLLVPVGSAQTVRVQADGLVSSVISGRGCWL